MLTNDLKTHQDSVLNQTVRPEILFAAGRYRSIATIASWMIAI
jgi:hypothetical protein